jgi:ATP-dependent Clp protease ATP-binding subunit ClpA
MENKHPFLEKFSESGRRILEGALNETRRREQFHVAPEHILYGLMTEETDLFDATMHNLSLDPQEIRLNVEKRLENSRRHIGKGFRIAPETTEIFKYSMDKARSEGRRTIEANNICFVFATNKPNMLDDTLKNPESHTSVFRKIFRK